MSSPNLAIACWLWLVSLHALPAFAQKVAQDILGPVPSDIQSTLVELAKRVEDEQGVRNPNVDGLVKRVETLLKVKAPPPRSGLLSLVRLPKGGAFVTPALRSTVGLVFNSSFDGVEAEIFELGTLLDSASDPLPIRFRMAALATSLSPDAATNLRKAAAALARERILRNGNDAEAHAWLAECLKLESDETKRQAVDEAQLALKLDEKCWRAMLVLAELESTRALFELQPGGAPPLGEPAPQADAFLRAIYDHPPSDERVALMQKTTAVAEQWFKEACECAPREAEPLLRYVAHRALAGPMTSRMAELARGQRPKSFDAMRTMSRQLQGIRSLKDDPIIFGDLVGAANLRPDDPHLTAGAVLLPFFFMGLQTRPDEALTLSDKEQGIIDETLQKLEQLARSPDASVTARAIEATVVLQGMFKLKSSEKLQLPRRCLDALKLSPHRYSAWEFLCVALVGAKRFPELNAASEIRFAMRPSAWQLQCLVAAAGQLRDWKRGQAVLLAELERNPGNVRAKFHLGAVQLAEAIESGSADKVRPLFEELRDIYSNPSAGLTSEDKEDFIVNLAVLFAFQRRWEEASSIIDASQAAGRISAEAAAKFRALKPN